MAGRIPLRGDLHVHTCRSDGKESPEIVCANYRAHGYDFTVISDHHRYYPSLEAQAFYKNVTDMSIVQGEEVHLPLNDVHYVNFGGSYSINALVKPSPNEEKAGSDLACRSKDGNAPEPMSREEFCEMIRERAKSVPRENESERLSYAVLEWTYGHIKDNGGLGIFPHPYWLCQMMQLPEDYTEFIYKNAPFDAFEVLGGENYYQHNGFQTALYYDMKSKGYDRPVVGSTDTHGSTEHNRNALICSTVVFARENTDKALIEAIKEKYSVAVDTISSEYRLVGDFRWVKYGSFLLENYFPLHDLLCKAEGYYMKLYATGDVRAESVLSAMKGQIPELQKKYFSL
jgi:predicted metal-dependent phosphoesterase TrpH